MEQYECHVNVQLARLLQVTRLLGAAPVHITLDNRGYAIVLSKKYVLYSSIFISLLATSYLITTIFYTYFVTEKDVLPFLMSVTILWDVFSKLFAMALMGYYCRKRFNRIIKYLVKIKEINAALNSEYIDIKLKRPAVIFWLMSTLFVFVHFTIILYIKTSDSNIINQAFYMSIHGIYYFIINIVYIIEIQYIYILCLIKATIDILNTRLRFYFTEFPLTLCSTAAIRINTKRLFRAYVSLCDLLADFNDQEGVTILSFIVFHISNIMSTNIINIGITIDPTNMLFYLKLLFITYMFVRFAIFVESCSRISVETVRQLVSELTATSRSAQDHLQCFQMNMLLHDPVVAPLGLFEVTRAFVIMVAGGIVTFVTILSQLENDDRT